MFDFFLNLIIQQKNTTKEYSTPINFSSTLICLKYCFSKFLQFV